MLSRLMSQGYNIIISLKHLNLIVNSHRYLTFYMRVTILDLLLLFLRLNKIAFVRTYKVVDGDLHHYQVVSSFSFKLLSK